MQSWLIYALLSACAAALATVFGKIGFEGLNKIDTSLPTAIRSVVFTISLAIFCTIRGAWGEFPKLNRMHFLNIVLSGLAGAMSWLCYYKALSTSEGKVFRVSSIDKLSVPIAVVLAFIFLSERPLPLNWLGIVLIVGGAYLVAYKPA